MLELKTMEIIQLQSDSKHESAACEDVGADSCPASWLQRRPSVQAARRGDAVLPQDLPLTGLGSAKLANFAKFCKFCKFLAGSFSAVSKRNFARRYAFDSIFQALQDLHPFAPLQSQNFKGYTLQIAILDPARVTR